MSYDHNLYNFLRSKFQKQRENNPSMISIIDREEERELIANKSKLFALTNCIETNSKPKANDSYYKAVDTVVTGDMYHICSDGVYNWIKPEQIDKIIKETKNFNELASNVIKVASANGSNDNLTSIFLKIQDGNKQ
jgi:serine/threonine protein phosphatase PrpC